MLSQGEEEYPQGECVRLLKSHTQNQGKESAEKLLLVHLGYGGRVPILRPHPLYLGCSALGFDLWGLQEEPCWGSVL